MYPVNTQCHLASPVAELFRVWWRENIWNCGRHMTFLGYVGSHHQAKTPVVIEQRNRWEKGWSPIVPVTQSVLISSWHCGVCGKPVSSYYRCLLETDWLFSGGIIDVSVSNLYLSVSLLFSFDGLIWVLLCHQQGFCSLSSQLPAGNQRPSAAAVSYTHQSSGGSGWP